MDKLQFDSFYKFIVSLGIVFITAPVIFVYFLISNSYGLILSNQEYTQLSEMSISFINTKLKWINIGIQWFPWIMVSFILIGLSCIIWGGINWYKNQKERDRKILLENTQLEFNVEQMKPLEIAEKMVKEVDLNSSNPDTNRDRMIRAFQVEDACYLYIRKALQKKSYDFKQNIRIGKIEYDFIATSKKDNIDLIYEIRYFTYSIPINLFKRIYEALLSAGNNYEQIVHRNFRLVLIIVSNNKLLISMRNKITNYIEESNIPIKVEFLDEKELLP